jgi:excinuclease ABC subunit A
MRGKTMAKRRAPRDNPKLRVDSPTSSPKIPEWLVVHGARVHNLKSVSVEIPHRNLIAFTGRSGSGKSSLAFDTIFAEGQRRSVQSLSSYARQFLGQFDKPDVDTIDGLCSAVAIDQETSSRNPRSTVGTITDIYDMLRLLYSRIGRPHCPRCNRRLAKSSSAHFGCPKHPEVGPPDLAARAFSFNLPFGACPECTGLRTAMAVNTHLVVPEPDQSLAGGALAPWATDRWAELHALMVRALAQKLGVATDVSWRELPESARHTFLEGMDIALSARQPGRERPFEAVYEGLIPWVRRQHKEAASDGARERMEAFMREVPCPACNGGRLAPAQLAVKIGGKSIAEVSALPVVACAAFISHLELTPAEQVVASPVLAEMRQRLASIMEVGLEYLTLDRAASTLSGGEAQRIRLSTQLGTNLFGLLYVFDEPTVGLHPRDSERLVASLKRLRDQGNTVIVVEHNQDVILAADWAVELGPGAGERGGEILFSGPLHKMLSDPDSLTGAYLSGRQVIPIPRQRRPRRSDYALVVHGARAHNLKDIDVAFPLGCLIAVTGASGSGKSTLVNDILYCALARKLHQSYAVPGDHDGLSGIDLIEKVIHVDQAPIGRTPRSNPATYTGVFDQIRNVFARTSEAHARRYRPGRFSSNLPGGRCEACAGDGTIRIEMQFLADVYVPCDTCHGARYNQQTLEIRYKNHTIADVLALSVEEAQRLFADVSAIERPLRTLADVGLDYLRLGQPATTLSGGEAQRVKLATELWRRTSGHTVYILDEPTTGLHTDDVRRLLDLLNGLVEKGHTVIVIEHDLDVIKTADWVIDLGPDGGDGGGTVVATGTPEEVTAVTASHTGRYLRAALQLSQR